MSCLGLTKQCFFRGAKQSSTIIPSLTKDLRTEPKKDAYTDADKRMKQIVAISDARNFFFQILC